VLATGQSWAAAVGLCVTRWISGLLAGWLLVRIMGFNQASVPLNCRLLPLPLVKRCWCWRMATLLPRP